MAPTSAYLRRELVFVVNVALAASQWQHRVRTIYLHLRINTKRECGQTQVMFFSSLRYARTGNQIQPTSFGGACSTHCNTVGIVFVFAMQRKRLLLAKGYCFTDCARHSSTSTYQNFEKTSNLKCVLVCDSTHHRNSSRRYYNFVVFVENRQGFL